MTIEIIEKRNGLYKRCKKIEKLKPIANSHGWDITEISMKYILSQKQISVLLPTVTSIEEIDLFAQISDGNYLNEDEKLQIEQMYERNFDMPKLVA
jgi:aryl-alcohol dehydrogenase-like predicted oxidoreductase